MSRARQGINVVVAAAAAAGVVVVGVGLWVAPFSEARQDSPTELAIGEPAPKLVELSMEACSVCKRMKPALEKAVATCGHGIERQAIDIADPAASDWTESDDFAGVPTYVFLDGAGDEMLRLTGAQPEAVLGEALASLTGRACQGLAGLNRAVDQSGQICTGHGAGAEGATSCAN